MTRKAVALAGLLAFTGFFGADVRLSHGQAALAEGQTVIMNPSKPVETGERFGLRRRRPWRERNPYYVARPVYPTPAPGQRANVTFEPFTSKYYPTINSYYPPLNPQPSVRVR